LAKFDEQMGQKVGEITEDETFTKHGWLAFVPSMFLTAWGSVEGGANGMISAQDSRIPSSRSLLYIQFNFHIS